MPTDPFVAVADLAAWYGHSHILHWAADVQSRVTYNGLLRQHNVLNRIANIADETIAPVIERVAKASTSREQFKSGIRRVETKVVA